MTSARAHGDDGRVVEDHLLSVRDLKVTFLSRHGTALAVKGVDFDLARGKVLAIVGESGCGKWGSRAPPNESTAIRTSSPAACASGS